MASFSDTNYKKYLLPKRLIFLDLDGTIIPSTYPNGRRVAIALNTYNKIREFAHQHFRLPALLEIDENLCSKWYRSYDGPLGLINHILEENQLENEIKDCLSFYFTGLFNQRLTEYMPEDLAYDTVPEAHLDFLYTLSKISTMVLVSYRYQNQFEFLRSIKRLNLDRDGLFGPNNAFAVGNPGTSSDGSKSRFIGGKWRHEIRAQRRLTSVIGKTFPPIAIGDSIRDIHFAIDIGGIFFGVSETGEDSAKRLLAEFRKQGEQLHIRSRIFSSLADSELQSRLIEECEGYQNEIESLYSEAAD